MISISVVIPTRNRSTSMERLLRCFNEQTVLPDEVIIVDASDDPQYLTGIKQKFDRLNVLCKISLERSVCIQRNMGIALAQHDWIFLCDDDIEIPSDHLEKLVNYLKHQPN